eukprot:12980113-Alexandrium_andersonii.AAC.1
MQTPQIGPTFVADASGDKRGAVAAGGEGCDASTASAGAAEPMAHACACRRATAHQPTPSADTTEGAERDHTGRQTRTAARRANAIKPTRRANGGQSERTTKSHDAEA